MLLHMGLFQQNGGIKCGYVKKPEWMTSTTKNALYPNNFSNPVMKIKIKIIAA